LIPEEYSRQPLRDFTADLLVQLGGFAIAG
jgi:hypothetical protein